MKLVRNDFCAHPLIAAALLLLIGCAHQVSPTGGPKDVAPPKITASVPLNNSVRFSGQQIVLEFDEFVQIATLSQDLIISPPLKYKPEIKLRGKKLTVSIKDTLEAATTYLVNFGNGVKDITEGNPLDSNVFVFSTGDFIDSLYVEGSIKNAVDLSPAGGAWIMLYDELADSVPISQRPSYFAKVRDNGTFRIDYVRPGKFKLFALADINNNYLFDLPDEPIAYTDSVVNPAKNTLYKLSMFTQEIELQYLKKGYVDGYGKLVFLFNKPTEDPRVRALNTELDADWAIRELNKTKDTLTYWLTKPRGADTLQLEVRDFATPMDTTELILKTRQASIKSKGKKKQQAFELSFNTSVRAEQFDAFRKLVLVASHPLASYDKKQITLTENDSIVPFEIKLESEVKRRMEIVYPWKEEHNYALLIPKGACTDIFELQNDTMLLRFKTLRPDDYGNLALKINLPDSAGAPQYVVQLMNKADQVLQENVITGSTTLNYKNLLPGSLKVKLIYDTNSNGKWDTGKYTRDEKRQPEQVIYYSGAIDIRANWDLELDWNTEPKGFGGKGKK